MTGLGSQDVHGAGAVIQTGDATAGDMGHANPRPFDLERATTSLELPGHFNNLGRTRWANWMAP